MGPEWVEAACPTPLPCRKRRAGTLGKSLRSGEEPMGRTPHDSFKKQICVWVASTPWGIELGKNHKFSSLRECDLSPAMGRSVS